ncbi:MAG TPA: GNAT family N-acetyltransferase [Pirellulales bacterium]|jgi:CelD/BcsL family acetyltransferase involved in cellulose biosynthesis|nr:GNAT family N-acetyltransferase [Pirellulales bacterium]
MSHYRIEILTSLGELRAAAAHWDDLWLRSEAPAPTARAETVAQWIEAFAPQARWFALMVFDGSRPVAAMLLTPRKVRGRLELGSLPINAWCDCGDLLLDPAARTDEAADLLLRAITEQAPWPLVWLDSIALDQSRWQLLAAAARRAELGVHLQSECEVGRVALPADWRQYEASWSANHRRQMRRAERRALADGRLELRTYANPSCEQLHHLLEQGFDIEHRSWKGAAGTSVLQNEILTDFLTRQSEQLAAWHQLLLVFLEHNGRAIAFELGHMAKGIYFSTKVGYDPAYAAYTPGQLLRLLWLRQLQAGTYDSIHTVDFWGPLSEATAKWSNQRYRAGRMVIAMPGLAGRGLFALYGLARRAKRRPAVLAPAPAESDSVESDPVEPAPCA